MLLPGPILFFGMHGPFSIAPLQALLAAQASIAAVIIPAIPQQHAAIEPLAPHAGPLQPANIVHLAWQSEVPVYAARHCGPEVIEQLAPLAPAVACVACWPYRIPPELLALPRAGFLNIHPSLLPAYRGPHPLFWALRAGLRATGVTVHWMSAELDRGDIALQAPLPLPEGVGAAVLEQAAGELGGQLLVAVLQQLAAGNATRRPQPPGGSYQPAPQAADFTLDPFWPARRAYNFMRGTAGWGQPYPLSIGGETLYLRRALGYDPAARLPAPVVRAGAQLHLQFTPGILLAED
jgi:methionyl-tRNA formyltransferase